MLFADIFSRVSTILPDKFHYLKIFMVKILRKEQNPQKPRIFCPSKLTCYTVSEWPENAFQQADLVLIPCNKTCFG